MNKPSRVTWGLFLLLGGACLPVSAGESTPSGEGSAVINRQIEPAQSVLDAPAGDQGTCWLAVVDAAPGEGTMGSQPLAVPVHQLNDREYYLMGDGETCLSNTPDRTRIKTWRNHVSFHEGRVLFWGNACNDSPVSLTIPELLEGLTVSADLLQLRHHGETLSYSPAPPQLCAAGNWCPEGTP